MMYAGGYVCGAVAEWALTERGSLGAEHERRAKPVHSMQAV